MLSVKYISNYLNKNEYENSQKRIDIDVYKKLQEFETKKDIKFPEYDSENKQEKIVEKTIVETILSKDYESLPESFEKYFNNHYCLFKIKNRNKSNIFTFFSSLFIIGNEEYILFNYDEKLTCIKSFIKKMDDALFTENHYEKFGYHKNKYFNKEKILHVLKEAFQCRVNEYFGLLLQHVSNFLGVNMYIFELKNNEIVSKLSYLSNKYNFKEENEKKNINYYLPSYFIIKEDDMYYPILKKSDTNINYLIHDEIKDQRIFKILEKFDIQLYSVQKTNNHQFDKMKLDELREYALKENILITKISEKTGKEIKKKKDELIEDLKKI